MKTSIKRAAVLSGFGLAMAAGSASAGFGSNALSIWVGSAETGTEWYSATASGQFLDDNTFVAMIDLSGLSVGGGSEGIEFGSSDFIRYEIQGSNLRMGGGAQTVNLNFNVSAGFANTAFALSAAPVAFPAFATATGLASATVGLTASSNPLSAPGATFSPDGAGAYQANYSGGGSVFADLFGAALSIPSGSDTFTENFAGALFGSVGDIGAEWNFTLSARDQASGVSTFTVVPAPGAAALLGLGGLMAARRRR